MGVAHLLHTGCQESVGLAYFLLKWGASISGCRVAWKRLLRRSDRQASDAVFMVRASIATQMLAVACYRVRKLTERESPKILMLFARALPQRSTRQLTIVSSLSPVQARQALIAVLPTREFVAYKLMRRRNMILVSCPRKIVVLVVAMTLAPLQVHLESIVLQQLREVYAACLKDVRQAFAAGQIAKLTQPRMRGTGQH